MLRSTVHARAGLAVSALILAAVAITLSRPTLGFTSAAIDTPGVAPAVAPTEPYLFERQVFELQVGGPDCSIYSVDGAPDRPPTADGIRSIYVYADDVYETYTALCRAGS
jgi:hypothetical protein